jgi:hypothetical protein
MTLVMPMGPAHRTHSVFQPLCLEAMIGRAPRPRADMSWPPIVNMDLLRADQLSWGRSTLRWVSVRWGCQDIVVCDCGSSTLSNPQQPSDVDHFTS